MIEVTRLNGTRIVLNSDLIKMAEALPDTMVTLMNGEKLIVRESLEEVIARMLRYKAMLLAAAAQHLPCSGDPDRVSTLATLDAIEPAEAFASTQQ
jgi:flagellar protein FlbD